MNQPKPTLVQNLKLLMAKTIVRDKPISANELARQSGVPQSTITRILSEDTMDPRVAQLEKLANFFDVSVSELRGESPASMAPSGDQIKIFKEVNGTHYLAYLSSNEIELLKAYRSTNDVGRRAIQDVVKTRSKRALKAA